RPTRNVHCTSDSEPSHTRTLAPSSLLRLGADRILDSHQICGSFQASYYWTHRRSSSSVVACVVLVDLASYNHSLYGTAGTQWMTSLTQTMMAACKSTVAGVTSGTIPVQWACSQAKVIDQTSSFGST